MSTPRWGDDLEEDYKRGVIITDPVRQAAWRMDELELILKFRHQRVVTSYLPSRWSWAIHCKKIEEAAFA